MHLAILEVKIPRNIINWSASKTAYAIGILRASVFIERIMPAMNCTDKLRFFLSSSKSKFTTLA
jgi:hypothetical protein